MIVILGRILMMIVSFLNSKETSVVLSGTSGSAQEISTGCGTFSKAGSLSLFIIQTILFSSLEDNKNIALLVIIAKHGFPIRELALLYKALLRCL